MRRVGKVSGPQVPTEFRKDIKSKPSKEMEFFEILNREVMKRGGWKNPKDIPDKQTPDNIWEGL